MRARFPVAVPVILLFLTAACHSKPAPPVLSRHDTLISPEATKPDPPTTTVQEPMETDEADPNDSLAKAAINTSTLAGKRADIMRHFLLDHSPGGAEYDTLVDVNYDGHQDYLIGYYGAAGTGFKNRVNTYLYDPAGHRYRLSEQLSLTNPTFYLKQRRIVSFYIGNGGGGGRQLAWIRGKWRTSKEFNVDNMGDSTVWHIRYPLLHRWKIIRRPFMMVPPEEILDADARDERDHDFQ